MATSQQPLINSLDLGPNKNIHVVWDLFKWLCLINSHSQYTYFIFIFEESEHIIAHHPIHIIFLLLTSILSTFYVRQHFFLANDDNAPLSM